MTSGFAGEKQKHYFMVFSNPIDSKEDVYLKWYEGQHIHDLLRIPGFVAAQFFKLSDAQYGPTQSQRYLMIWEIETDDLPRGIGFAVRHEHADAPHSVALLGMRRERPRRRAAERSDEFSPSKANAHLSLLCQGTQWGRIAQPCGGYQIRCCTRCSLM
jgi:hypothetical protein